MVYFTKAELIVENNNCDNAPWLSRSPIFLGFLIDLVEKAATA
jgi:hypothetical protein